MCLDEVAQGRPMLCHVVILLLGILLPWTLNGREPPGFGPPREDLIYLQCEKCLVSYSEC